MFVCADTNEQVMSMTIINRARLMILYDRFMVSFLVFVRCSIPDKSDGRRGRRVRSSELYPYRSIAPGVHYTVVCVRQPCGDAAGDGGDAHHFGRAKIQAGGLSHFRNFGRGVWINHFEPPVRRAAFPGWTCAIKFD